MSEQFGDGGVISFVKGFKCLEYQLDDAEEAIAVALYGGSPRNKNIEDEVMLVENALAWFALEEVGRSIEELS